MKNAEGIKKNKFVFKVKTHTRGVWTCPRSTNTHPDQLPWAQSMLKALFSFFSNHFWTLNAI